MLERLRVDVVGMSTAAEAEAAIKHGIAVLGLSLVTNRGAGRSGAALTHEAVLRVSAGGVDALSALVRAVVSRLPSTG
jgi:purine-nucleoside phosphorylase